MAAPDLASDVEAYARFAAELSAAPDGRDALLGAHGLDEERWEAIEESWAVRFSAAEDAAGEEAPPLLVAFANAFAEAQRRGADGQAELTFDGFVAATRELASGKAPETVLARLGISLGTYLRSQRVWTQRFLRDPELAARFVRAIAPGAT